MLKLKDIRIKKGLKRQDIANILDVSVEAARRYELELRKLNQDEIIKLCLALDVTPDELLGYEEAYKKYTEYLKTLDEEDTEQ